MGIEVICHDDAETTAFEWPPPDSSSSERIRRGLIACYSEESGLPADELAAVVVWLYAGSVHVLRSQEDVDELESKGGLMADYVQMVHLPSVVGWRFLKSGFLKSEMRAAAVIARRAPLLFAVQYVDGDVEELELKEFVLDWMAG
jgi:hypothetical protein